MRWPREELVTVRPLRRSPLYDRLKAKRRGVRHASSTGSARTTSCRTARASPPYTLDTPGWLPFVLEEQRACREDVVVFDQTSFAKFVLKGRDALAVLQRLCANAIDVAVGRIVYTAMLNARGGFESDLTITRVAANEFFILTGSAQATRDFAWIERHIGDDEHAALVDVTSAYSVLSLMGPQRGSAAARAVARRRVEGGAAVLDDADDRRRLRARARGAHELRRRSRATSSTCRPTNA